MNYMPLETASVISHDLLCDDYRVLTLSAPGVGSLSKPGQFVHVRVPSLESAVLRRPFSIFRADAKGISILYKRVGSGTGAMTRLQNGDNLSIMGPLGNGYPPVSPACCPVLVGGGYGAAALRLLAERSSVKGIVFLGAACRNDLLCVDEFKTLGWETRTTTLDGSAGSRGLVTGMLDKWLAADLASRTPEFFACGPAGMLRALADRAIAGSWMAWLSMERHMGCGVGACLGCAQKVKHAGEHCDAQKNAAEDGKWTFARVCLDGPVFECREIVWD